MIRGKAAGWTSTTILLAVALALAGCGGSKTSRAEYIERGDAVCASVEQDIAAVDANRKPASVKVREKISYRERANAQLRAIPVPAPDNRLSEFLHEREVSLAELKKSVSILPGMPGYQAARTGEVQAAQAARRFASQYGLQACSLV